MEGLIKGLAKAAIDALDGGGDDEAPRRQRPAAEDAEQEEGREDRDRSTWAEVRARGCSRDCGLCQTMPWN
jgi:hypothetical protein